MLSLCPFLLALELFALSCCLAFVADMIVRVVVEFCAAAYQLTFELVPKFFAIPSHVQYTLFELLLPVRQAGYDFFSRSHSASNL